MNGLIIAALIGAKVSLPAALHDPQDQAPTNDVNALIDTDAPIVAWVLCAILVVLFLAKSWPTLRRAFGIGDALGGLPELTVEVASMAASMREMNALFGKFDIRISGIEKQVTNSHIKNLRDDMDDKHDIIVGEIAVLQNRISETAPILSQVLEKQKELDRDILLLHERIDHFHPEEGGHD